VARREAALAPLIGLLDGWHAEAPQAPAIAIEALTGGIYALAFKAIKQGGPESLPSLAAISTYFALAPLIGAEAACTAANSDGLPHSLRERHESNATVLRPIEDRILVFLSEHATNLDGIARGIGEPLTDVTEAVERLVNSGLVDVGDEPTGDGPAERIYRSPSMRVIETPEWEKISRPERERISAQVRDLIAGDIEGAVREETFDARTDRHLARIPLLLDEQGWAELAELHTTIISDTVDIQAKTLERLKESGEAPINARSIIFLFEVPEEET
jgi:hypothetical protein